MMHTTSLLPHLMLLREVTDQGRLEYDHPLGLCLVAAGRGDTIPDARKHSICPIQRGCNFVAVRDKLAPFCRVASHTSEEVRDILSTLEQEYQPLFPQLNLRQWTSSIYAWLTHPVLDPTRERKRHDGQSDEAGRDRSGMVVVFPEKPMWPPRGSSPLQSCWCCIMIRSSSLMELVLPRLHRIRHPRKSQV